MNIREKEYGKKTLAIIKLKELYSVEIDEGRVRENQIVISCVCLLQAPQISLQLVLDNDYDKCVRLRDMK
jgi:hypothetical protein